MSRQGGRWRQEEGAWTLDAHNRECRWQDGMTHSLAMEPLGREPLLPGRLFHDALRGDEPPRLALGRRPKSWSQAQPRRWQAPSPTRCLQTTAAASGTAWHPLRSGEGAWNGRR